jgi:hypothetical protein
VDVFLYQHDADLTVDPEWARAAGIEPVAAAVAREDGLAHDPGQLAKALQALL